MPGHRSGHACIRGLRVTVWDVLDMLASGMTEDDVPRDYPYLEKADFPAVYAYSSQAGRERMSVEATPHLHWRCRPGEHEPFHAEDREVRRDRDSASLGRVDRASCIVVRSSSMSPYRQGPNGALARRTTGLHRSP
ncbi:MAG: DUF433 domain-containing protein [Bryobacteraceae bacterium]